MKFRQLEMWLVLIAVFGLGCTGQNRIEREARSFNPGNSEMALPTPANVAAQRGLDVPYVPTHQTIVDEMLTMAEVKGDDVLYDLGSGDGRIPITAAKRYGTRGVGIDLNPTRIKEANENAQAAGVTDKVRFIEGDIFQEDFSQATVLTLYLLPQVNLRLRPQILKMKPGTRVVSHNYDMGDWQPEKVKTITTPDGVEHYVYFWRVPEPKQ